MVPYSDTIIEVATARAEKYESHSRKPHIAESDLRDDLARRDFTIMPWRYHSIRIIIWN
jgi:tRNA nucleotidyltransferase/poly(A) polymerase